MTILNHPPRPATAPSPAARAPEPAGGRAPSLNPLLAWFRAGAGACRTVAGWVIALLVGAGVKVLLALDRLGERITDRARRAGEVPDAGMESADKILWAAAVTVIVGVVGLAMKNMLVAAVNSIRLNLGW